MSLSAQVIAELIDAGLAGDALKAACRRIEDSQSVTNDVTVTPGALRQRRYVERHKASLSVTNDVTDVTMTKPTYISNNSSLSVIDSSKEKDMSESVTKASRGARRSIAYTDTFKTFWVDYPSDPGMSKADAFMEFQKFSDDDKAAAIRSLPAFKAWIPKQGKDYRVIHACNYLKQRRFDGFVEAAKAIESIQTTKVWTAYGSPSGEAWEAWYKSQGRIAPRDGRNGWWQESEWPPDVARETPAMRKTG